MTNKTIFINTFKLETHGKKDPLVLATFKKENFLLFIKNFPNFLDHETQKTLFEKYEKNPERSCTLSFSLEKMLNLREIFDSLLIRDCSNLYKKIKLPSSENVFDAIRLKGTLSPREAKLFSLFHKTLSLDLKNIEKEIQKNNQKISFSIEITKENLEEDHFLKKLYEDRLLQKMFT